MKQRQGAADRTTSSHSTSRRALLLAAAVLSQGVTARVAMAQQDYPNRPVRLVDPYAPGGSTTVVSRALSQRFPELAGQSLVVDHRPGAGSNIGSDIVAKAAPDGYTLLLGTSSLAINPSLYRRMPFDPIRDLAPILVLIKTPNVLAVHPSLPVSNVRELIDHAKANPGKLNYGSSGNGATNHMGMELFKRTAGVDMVHVPYKGGADAMTALLGGQVQAMLNPASTLAPQHRAGRLRMLAVGSDHRIEGLDLPTIAGSGLPGFESGVWFGLFAPAGTPAPIISRLNADINKALRDAQIVDALKQAGMEPIGGPAEDMRRLLADESVRWAEVVKAAGVQID